MPKLRNIKLKHTLVSFLLLSIFFSVKNTAMNSDNVAVHDNTAMNSNNIATKQSNDETSYIKTVTEKILGEDGYLCGSRGNIIDWIGTSIYNHYTEHNLRETGWYYGKFYIYGGGKIKITKNVYLDVYYSFLKLIPFYIIDVNIYGGWRYLLTLFAFITININIHIYKNFYLAIAPIHYILYKIMVSLVYMSHRQKWDQELEDEKRSIN